MRLPWLLIAVCSCSPSGYYSGALDLERTDRGEIYIDRISLGSGQYMVHAVAMVDAPSARLFNVLEDFDNYPLWNTAISRATVLKHDGDGYDVEMQFHPGVISPPPETERVRIDRQRGEISAHGYENEWVRELDQVFKLEQYQGNKRTLINIYSHSDLKPWWGGGVVKRISDQIVQIVANLRRVVALDRYAQPPGAAAAKRSKVAIPSFRSKPDDEALARTLSRICAEELMRKTPWNVLTQDEVAALLSFSGQQQLLGCTNKGQCAQNLSQLLDAERLVNGELARAGNLLTLSAALVRVKDAVVERRITVEAPDEATLLQRMHEAAAGLGG